MGRRRELREIDRYNAARTGDSGRHSRRSLDGHARQQVSEYTRLERRPLARGNARAWSSLTGLAWLIILGVVVVVAAVITAIVLAM